MTLQDDTSDGVSAEAAKKVLIVDDSRVMRAWLRTVLAFDERVELAGEASNAVEARDFLMANEVDVITLDIEMPGMSGLEFLARLMRSRPMPVVMLSSLTSKGSDAAIQALSRGAIDCILKPTDGFDQRLSRDICDRVVQAACTKSMHLVDQGPIGRRPVQQKVRQSATACHSGNLILIGSSTGGVGALETVLPALDPQGPPVVIVQHMPGNFLESFADRLQRELPQNVSIAQEGVPLKNGDVVLAPGRDQHTEVLRRPDGWHCKFTDDIENDLHCPAVNRLFHSAVPEAKKISAAILTGLGKDGAQGLLQLSRAGAATFGQDETTSVVYGMPRAAFEIGAVQHQLPVERIGRALRESFKRSSPHIH